MGRIVLSLNSEYTDKVYSYTISNPARSDSELRQLARDSMVEEHCPTWQSRHDENPLRYPDLATPSEKMSEESGREYLARQFLSGTQDTFGTFSDKFGMRGKVVVNGGSTRRTLTLAGTRGESMADEASDTSSLARSNSSESFVCREIDEEDLKGNARSRCTIL